MASEGSLRDAAQRRVSDELRTLKLQSKTGRFVEVNPAGYTIWIVGRGEHLFYQEGDRALFAVISLEKECVSESSLDYWDDRIAVNDEERARILARILDYFARFQQMKFKIAP